MVYAGEKPVDPLTLDVYPSGRSSATLYEDDGTTLDYDTSLVSKGFIFNNPNAKSSCGCGTSFSA